MGLNVKRNVDGINLTFMKIYCTDIYILNLKAFMKKCTVDMIVNVSHDIDEFGFRSGNRYQIIDNDTVYTKYNSNISFTDNIPEELINIEFEKEAQIASLAMSRNEKNPAYGCPFLTVDWKSFKIESIAATTDSYAEKGIIFKDHINISEYLDMKLTRRIELNEIRGLINHKPNYSFDIEIFYHGLMSNNAKSKFFNFFIIIERLEHSEAYKKIFNNDFLFSKEEKDEIKLFAEHYEKRKKGEILEILNHTKLSRTEKLFQYLQSLNLECINTEIIRIDDIKNIIGQRNKLFHSSEEFNNDLVYEKLFPLVRELVIRQLTNKNQE
jgi:hypothetical protein